MPDILNTPADEFSAICALQSIHDRGGSPDQVFATALGARLEAEWAKTNGLTRAKGHPCVHRLLDFHCAPAMAESCDCVPPFTDHPSLWMKDGKPHCLVSQPYEMDMESIEDITAFCKQHGLSFTIDAYPAFHFPTRALFVVFQPAEKSDGPMREP